MPKPLSKRGRHERVEHNRVDANSDSEYPGLSKMVRWDENMIAPDERQGESSDPEEEQVVDKICLATLYKLGRIGCAFYDPVKCVLLVLEDTEESSHFELTNMLLEQSSADVVLTGSNADDDFIDFLRGFMDVTGGFFQIRPHKDFVPSKGRDRLLSLPIFLDLPEDNQTLSNSDDLPNSKSAYDFMRRPTDFNEDPTMKRWNASIRLSNFASVESSPLCMASIGALLDHLVRERATGGLDGDGIRSLEVCNLEIISLDQVMQINTDALISLQIFENESHASVHSDKVKEGLSLFGILNNTKTSLGRSLLRNWLFRPSLSLDTIKARHDAVACFSNSENIVPAKAIHGHLKGIKNVPRILNIMRTGRAKVSDWRGLVKFSFHAAMIRNTLANLHQAADLEITEKLTLALNITILAEVGRKINEIIDWEESVEAARVCVRRHVDEALDNRKHVYHGIDAVLSKVAEKICEKVPYDYATSLNVVYFPQLGFLICLPMLEEYSVEENVRTIDGWTFQFSSNEHIYFKSQEMHDMDVHIGDLHSLIVDREIEIIQGLLEEILIYDEAMGQACQVCAELDCLLSFSEASRMYNYRRPEMVKDNIINIHQGRHPLQEQVVDIFVPNDVFIAGGAGQDLSLPGLNGASHLNSVLICTGANACGKSVYLKQIALIQYMAQIGCFVPAESATLGIVDKIYTRVSTRESVSRIQSAFMIDLNQVSLALRNCTPRSLVLLDEFGKGTLSTDGAGLFCGVLRHLLDRGPDCPKVLIASHFHDVFREDVLDPNTLPISFCHMQVMFTSSDGTILEANPDATTDYDEPCNVGNKITYLYRVAKGLSLDSHAAKCAAICGVPSRIVQRARYVSQLISKHEVCRLLDEDMTDQERLDLENAEAVCRHFLSWDLDAANQDDDVKAKLAKCLRRGLNTEDE